MVEKSASRLAEGAIRAMYRSSLMRFQVAKMMSQKEMEEGILLPAQMRWYPSHTEDYRLEAEVGKFH